MTESPRSSVRQYNPASKRPEDTRPSSARRSSSVKVCLVAWSLTSSMPKKYPSPRTSPTMGRSYSFSRVARSAGECCRDAVVEALALEDVQVGQRDGRRHRVTAEGVAVREHRGAVVERLEQPVAGDHRAQRRVARRQALGAGDHVGHVAEVVAGEHRPDPAERADHLVGNQQHVVLVADLANPLEIAGRRRDGAAGVLHRFQEHRGDGVRALELDRLGDAVGGPLPEGLEVGFQTGLNGSGAR